MIGDRQKCNNITMSDMWLVTGYIVKGKERNPNSYPLKELLKMVKKSFILKRYLESQLIIKFRNKK